MPVVVLVFVRDKIRHARLVGDKNGIKLSQQEQNAPNWEILGLLGEFCTGTGAVWLVWGEFCTGTGTVWLVWGEFCTGSGGVPVLLLVVAGQNSPCSACWRQKRDKISQQEQNAPNWEILGVQGEYCTGTAGPNSRGESVAPIVPPHSVDGGCEVGITKPPGAWPGGAGAGDGNRTRL